MIVVRKVLESSFLRSAFSPVNVHVVTSPQRAVAHAFCRQENAPSFSGLWAPGQRVSAPKVWSFSHRFLCDGVTGDSSRLCSVGRLLLLGKETVEATLRLKLDWLVSA